MSSKIGKEDRRLIVETKTSKKCICENCESFTINKVNNNLWISYVDGKGNEGVCKENGEVEIPLQNVRIEVEEATYQGKPFFHLYDKTEGKEEIFGYLSMRKGKIRIMELIEGHEYAFEVTTGKNKSVYNLKQQLILPKKEWKEITILKYKNQMIVLARRICKEGNIYMGVSITGNVIIPEQMGELTILEEQYLYFQQKGKITVYKLRSDTSYVVVPEIEGKVELVNLEKDEFFVNTKKEGLFFQRGECKLRKEGKIEIESETGMICYLNKEEKIVYNKDFRKIVSAYKAKIDFYSGFLVVEELKETTKVYSIYDTKLVKELIHLEADSYSFLAHVEHRDKEGKKNRCWNKTALKFKQKDEIRIIEIENKGVFPSVGHQIVDDFTRSDIPEIKVISSNEFLFYYVQFEDKKIIKTQCPILTDANAEIHIIDGDYPILVVKDEKTKQVFYYNEAGKLLVQKMDSATVLYYTEWYSWKMGEKAFINDTMNISNRDGTLQISQNRERELYLYFPKLNIVLNTLGQKVDCNVLETNLIKEA